MNIPHPVLGLIHGWSLDALPEEAVLRLQDLTLDLIGVAAAGSQTPAASIIRAVAAEQFGGTVPILFGADRASASGAALAGATTIDAVDAHDGYREAKGHAGCATLPAVLATCDPDILGAEFLVRMALGYEIGCRAGVSLHATAAEYHTSGAWMALACAAIGARALRLDDAATRHALGIAEYHGPRSPMMRCIDHPTMVKDGSGWGAMAGIAAAHLAARGFTGAPASTVEDPDLGEIWANLGTRWLTLDQYVKPEPVCRWAQPAVHAALALRADHGFCAEDVVAVEITGFAAALRLACRHPCTTEEAQYSLPYPVAVALARGQVGPAEVAGAALSDPGVARLSGLAELREDAGYTEAFPGVRTSEVAVTLADGRRLRSGPTKAAGDPECPLDRAAIRSKFHAYADPVLGRDRAQAIAEAVANLRDGAAAPLLGLLCGAP